MQIYDAQIISLILFKHSREKIEIKLKNIEEQK